MVNSPRVWERGGPVPTLRDATMMIRVGIRPRGGTRSGNEISPASTPEFDPRLSADQHPGGRSGGVVRSNRCVHRPCDGGRWRRIARAVRHRGGLWPGFLRRVPVVKPTRASPSGSASGRAHAVIAIVQARAVAVRAIPWRAVADWPPCQSSAATASARNATCSATTGSNHGS